MKRWILVIGMTLVYKLLNAQPAFQPVEQAPIDGGLALLAAGGAAYGIRKLKQSKADQDSEI